MQVDYIIVGFGLAGLAFAETLERQQKSFVVFNDASQQSSLVAASLYNPVILKRFTPVWDVQDQLAIALPFYKQLEEKFNESYDDQLNIFRVFTSVEEQNNWFAACDKPVLRSYMHPEVITNQNKAVRAPFGLGKVSGTGKIRNKKLLADYQEYLLQEGRLMRETFDYESIIFNGDQLTYKEMKAKQIVFCEGFGLRKNPFFKELPLNGTKGELITIHAPDLKLDTIVKSSVFVLPLGQDTYKVGATFEHTDKSSQPTENAKKELIEKLETFINVPYDIVEHEAGIRPTVKDRRPLLGRHHIHKQLTVLNGLGTRGVLLAPKMAQLLYEHLENGISLPKEVSVERFS
ncbi:MAG: FAD-dependent oxidoreductase [Flavobacteriaceae bacterium]|nr:FAD-dependent oxidoreductase [Flavobacteriaceae bacterium]